MAAAAAQLFSVNLRKICGDALVGTIEGLEQCLPPHLRRMLYDHVHVLAELGEQQAKLCGQHAGRVVKTRHITDTVAKPRRTSRVCRFFAMGICRNGEACHFLHAAGAPEAAKPLRQRTPTPSPPPYSPANYAGPPTPASLESCSSRDLDNAWENDALNLSPREMVRVWARPAHNLDDARPPPSSSNDDEPAAAKAWNFFSGLDFEEAWDKARQLL